MQPWDNGSNPKPQLPAEMKAYFAGHPSKSNKVPVVSEKRHVTDAFFHGTQARHLLTDSKGTYKHEFLCTGKRVILDDAWIVKNVGDHECPEYVLSSLFAFPALVQHHPAMVKVVKTVVTAFTKRGYSEEAIAAMVDKTSPLPDFLSLVKPN